MASSESLPSAKRAKSPAESARKLLDRVDFITDDADTVFRHNGAFWEPLSEPTLRQLALECDLGKSTRSRRAELIDEIRARSHTAGLQWGRTADYEIAFKNGVVDVRTDDVRQHRPEDYLERVIPWDYEARAQAPIFLRTLGEWFGEPEPDQTGPIDALQEFCGYVLMPHARYKKALLIYGPSDSGKSIIPFLMALMVGHDRVGSLPLDQMDDLQRRAAIVGKALNLLTEITSSALIADGGFKAMISTEEPILIDAKYKAPFSYWPTAKHVFATNNLPGLGDRTEGVLNRLLIIPMMRVVPKDQQDEMLQQKLKIELPGILAWAVRGAKRLFEQGGRFSAVSAGLAVLDELRRRANPALDFVEERLVPVETSALPLEKLLDPFNRWRRGGKKVTKNGLGAMLRTGGYTVKKVRHGERVIASLVGFEFSRVTMPALLKVDAAEAALAGNAEIKSTGSRYAIDDEAPREEVDQDEAGA